MPRKRTPIFQRGPSKVWYARWPFKRSLRTTDKQAAIARYDEALKSWGKGVTRETEPTHPPTIAYFLKAFLRDVVPMRRKKRAARNATVRLTRATEPIRDMFPEALGTDDIEKVRNHLDASIGRCGHRLTPVAVHDHLRDLKMFLRWVNRKIPLRILPLERYIMPRLPQSGSKALPERVLLLLADFNEEPYKSTLVFLLFTGLRWGELRSLEWDLHVNLTAPARLRFVAPKTGAERIVYLAEPALQVIEAWQKITGEGDFVAPWRPQNPCTVFKRIGRQIGYHLSPNMFRHSFATYYGGDIEALRELMGHARLATTHIYRKPSQAFVHADFTRAFSGVTFPMFHATVPVDVPPTDHPKSGQTEVVE